MFKKLLAAVAALFVISACSGNVNRVADEPYPYNKLSSDTYMMSGALTVSDFRDFYRATKNVTDGTYTIVINSPGGDAQTCVGYINRIEELKARGVTVNTTVYSRAYSAGFFVWLMGDNRDMLPGSTLMVHTARAQYMYKRQGGFVDDAERGPLLDNLDEYIIAKTHERLPNVDWMTLETMLRYDGMTFFNDKEAKELGMF